jgi:bidirectional [NiFe] hydrogenase diaphorase subunit
MVSLTINGQSVRADEGMRILEAARLANIYIPTLCYHPLLEPLGACRLCVVEINNGVRSRLVTSCTYPVEEGLKVKTDSPLVVETRKMLIELLLARAPKAGVVQRLAQEYGVEKTQLKIRDEGQLCVLCGLCARVCNEIIGVCAINFIKRGVNREVTFNPEISPELCVGCGVCSAVCPTGCLELEKPYGVVAAIDMGRKAAISIDKYLGGGGIIEEELIEAETPNPWLGKDKGFADRPRVVHSFLLDGFNDEQAVQEAKRCLRCELRLQISHPIMPPEKWLEFSDMNLKDVPETEGVFQLFDSEKNVVYIKGAMNLLQELEEQLKSYEKAKYFIWEEDPMYTKRESELLQQFMQENGKLPEGNVELEEDLF